MAVIGAGQQPQQGKGFWNNLKDWAIGTPGQYNQVTNYDPNQLQRFNQVGQMGIENQRNPYAGFQPIQNEAVRQFNSETIPGLAERFTAIGGSGTKGGSSDFAGMLGGAGANLSSQLASLRAQYGQNQQDFGLRQLGLGQTQQYENIYEPGQEGFLSKLPGLAAEAGLMYATGGLSGAAGGANLIGKGVSALKGLSGANNPAKQQIAGMSDKRKRDMLYRLRSQQGAMQMRPGMEQAQSNLEQKNPGINNLDLGNTSIGASARDYWSPIPSWLQVNG